MRKLFFKNNYYDNYLLASLNLGNLRYFCTTSHDAHPTNFVLDDFSDILAPESKDQNEKVPKEVKVSKQEKTIYYALKPAVLISEKELPTIISMFDQAVSQCNVSKANGSIILIHYCFILCESKPKFLPMKTKESLIELSSILAQMDTSIQKLSFFAEKQIFEKSLHTMSTNLQEMLSTKYNFSDTALTDHLSIRTKIEKILARQITLRYNSNPNLTFNVRVGTISKFSPPKRENCLFFNTTVEEIHDKVVSHKKNKEEKENKIPHVYSSDIGSHLLGNENPETIHKDSLSPHSPHHLSTHVK